MISEPPHRELPKDLLGRFVSIVGEAYALRDEADMEPHLVEWRDRWRGRAVLVLKPADTEEVAAILKLANGEGVGIVPQGGNTGLVGGQIPDVGGRQIVVSLARLNHVRDIDAAGETMVVDAGVTLAQAQDIAAGVDRLFPLSLASEGSCQIGGAIATNAGGSAVLAYGPMRNLVLGLEVVLPDGRVWDGLRRLRKDNTGYDLRDLFIGSEGTLGIVTAAALRLFPRPRATAAAFVGVRDLGRMLDFFAHTREAAGASLTTFEFMSRRALDFVLEFAPNLRDPLSERHKYYALVELSETAGLEAQPHLERLLGSAVEAGHIEDAALASTVAQGRALWRLREMISEAQKPQGGSIKHDVSVPVARIPEFIARAGDVVELICPGARPVPFGHFGDGNVHYNISQPPGMTKEAFLAQWDAVAAGVQGVVTDLGGSISAEHGIGVLKRDILREYKSEVELDLMRRVKTAFDPNGIMNPGKVL